MQFLLDMHTFLWFAEGSPRLFHRALDFIQDTGHELLLSEASIWEMAIKASLGRLELRIPLSEFVEGRLSQSSIRLLEIRPKHVYQILDLPFHHRDPFDRLLAAQCLVEDLQLIGADPVFDTYGVRRDW